MVSARATSGGGSSVWDGRRPEEAGKVTGHTEVGEGKKRGGDRTSKGYKKSLIYSPVKYTSPSPLAKPSIE